MSHLSPLDLLGWDCSQFKIMKSIDGFQCLMCIACITSTEFSRKQLNKDQIISETDDGIEFI